MRTNTKSNSFLQKQYIQFKTQSTFFTITKIGLLIVALVITSCSKDEDVNINQNCAEVSLKVKENEIDKTKVTVEATSSITDGSVYSWKVTDKNGSKEVNGNAYGSISWELEEGETKFCVTVKTADCNEDIEECITYNFSCENKNEVITSRPNKEISKPAFKNGYMYYAEQNPGILGVSKLAIYKLNLLDKNATPVKLIDIQNDIFGKAIDLVFKDDFLYISVSKFITFSKVFKMDTSLANPKLIEVLNFRPKAILGMSIQGNDMYAVGDIRPGLLKFDVTKPSLTPMELTTIGKKDPFEERTIIYDMARKANELYLLGTIDRVKFHVIKIDLDDPNLEQKIIVKNIDRVDKIELYNDDLYLLFPRKNNNGDWVDSWIGKLNTLESSPSIKKVNKEFGFRMNDIAFDKDFIYITINDYIKSQNEIVKVSICSL
ncbi:hypothetical protein [uncultured Tenacibaculum sp.]|uniref:hypothetical protein n=1 Tax=uncultured Tenacibaculum sp. TaxID=174713 RepID=UPI00260D1643|nr:hypothetical protein [uncultured Tenacibaculum sp.]